MSLVTRRSNHIFTYPPNIQVLDLATMVAMYRERGDIKKAKPGEYLACSANGKLLKEAKCWFGRFYSQSAWDDLLTKNSLGYPLTEVEFNVMGLVKTPPFHPISKEFIEQHCGAPQQLSYMIIQDLKKFGFLEETESGLEITVAGEKALDGVARRLFEINYIPEMLMIATHEKFNEWYKSGNKEKKSPDQISLF